MTNRIEIKAKDLPQNSTMFLEMIEEITESLPGPKGSQCTYITYDFNVDYFLTNILGIVKDGISKQKHEEERQIEDILSLVDYCSSAKIVFKY